jgi:hypothetical protein
MHVDVHRQKTTSGCDEMGFSETKADASSLAWLREGAMGVLREPIFFRDTCVVHGSSIINSILSPSSPCIELESRSRNFCIFIHTPHIPHNAESICIAGADFGPQLELQAPLHHLQPPAAEVRTQGRISLLHRVYAIEGQILTNS